MYREYMQETYDQEIFDNSQCEHNLHKLQNDPLISFQSQANKMSSSQEINDNTQINNVQLTAVNIIVKLH